MKTVAFIDCFVDSPVIQSVNCYSQNTTINCTYHMPSQYGLDSLHLLDKADGYIILGSASNVSEKLQWHKDLLDFIIPKIENNIPTLGICFGHQLIADYYGSKVEYLNSNKNILNNPREIIFTQSEMGISLGTKLTLAFAHAQVIEDLSNKFYSFASSDISKNEAIKHKEYNFWGIQAHPEASEQFFNTETSIDNDEVIKVIKKAGFSFIDKFISLL
jgi:GMP synthase-like glutamine amidotransferase